LSSQVLQRTFSAGSQPVRIQPEDLEGSPQTPALASPFLRAFVDKYIPNLLGNRAFKLSREFAEAILQATNSPIMKELLANWVSMFDESDEP
jgi:hypothetical protein